MFDGRGSAHNVLVMDALSAAAIVGIRINPGLSNSRVGVALSAAVRHCLFNHLHSSTVARFASCIILSPHFIRSPIVVIYCPAILDGDFREGNALFGMR